MKSEDDFLSWLATYYTNVRLSGVQYRYIKAYFARDNKAKFVWPNKQCKSMITELLEEYHNS